MKILVDADACPVKSIIVKVAKEMNIPVVMFIDTSHSFQDGYSEIVVVSKGRDSVDFALINRVEQGDIVVTQDYGVATMTLSRKAMAIHPNGFQYTEHNIEQLLFERYLSQKARNAGQRTSNPKKRKQIDDERFLQSFRSLCRQALASHDQSSK